jgi:hypothetical protein
MKEPINKSISKKYKKALRVLFVSLVDNEDIQEKSAMYIGLSFILNSLGVPIEITRIGNYTREELEETSQILSKLADKSRIFSKEKDAFWLTALLVDDCRKTDTNHV